MCLTYENWVPALHSGHCLWSWQLMCSRIKLSLCLPGTPPFLPSLSSMSHPLPSPESPLGYIQLITHSTHGSQLLNTARNCTSPCSRSKKVTISYSHPRMAANPNTLDQSFPLSQDSDLIFLKPPPAFFLLPF